MLTLILLLLSAGNPAAALAQGTSAKDASGSHDSVAHAFAAHPVAAGALLAPATLHSDTTGSRADALVLAEVQDLYDITSHASVLIDSSGSWSINEVTTDSLAARFTAMGARSPRHGYSSAVYWLRFPVEVVDHRDWLLEIGKKSLDNVQFYTSIPGTPVLEAGDAVPFHSRPVRHRRLLFPMPEQQQYDVHLRIHSNGPIEFPLRIWSERAVALQDRKEEFALGVFFGILAVMVLYNLVLYASLRDVSHLFFALFIASFAFYQASVERITFEYLWPDNLWWMDRANSFLAAICGTWALLFTRSFLDTRRFAPGLDRMLLWLIALCILVPAFVLVGPRSLMNEIVVYFFILLAPVMLMSAVVCVLNRDRAAVYYLMGWTVLLVGITAGMFGYLGVLPNQISGIASVRFTAITGIVLLSQIGLGYRYDQMRREREVLRFRIATDLHDEMGSGLTQISLYSELIQRESIGNVAKWADQMGHDAREMTRKMQDIVWAIKPGDEGWTGLELRMKDFSSRLLAPTEITFEMKGEAQQQPERISLEVRKNLLLIYKEIVHNAVRHARCSRVTVTYRVSRRHIWMRICDDGRGFDEAIVLENNGLRNLRYRAKEIGADLMVETAPGGPTCYELTMDLVPYHLNG